MPDKRVSSVIFSGVLMCESVHMNAYMFEHVQVLGLRKENLHMLKELW